MAILVASSTATNSISSCPLKLICFYLLLLFLEVFLRGRWVPLVDGYHSPLLCLDMIGRLKICFFGKSLVVWHLCYLNEEDCDIHWFLLQIWDYYFNFLTSHFLVLCLVSFFLCIVPTHWTVVLLNFLLAHGWSAHLLLTASGKCHVICGDIPVWHQHAINDSLESIHSSARPKNQLLIC